MQAVADALSLLANIVMARNSAKMRAIFDRWAQHRSGAAPPELIGWIAPTRTEELTMRDVFSFPIEQYADQLLPSRVIPKTHLLGLFFAAPHTRWKWLFLFKARRGVTALQWL
jgi:hypothetical protein